MNAEYKKTSILAAVVLLLALQRSSGFVLLILLPFLLIFVTYQLVRMIRKPGERKARGIRLAIWSLTFALAGSVLTYRNAASRNEADLALTRLLEYKQRTGSYPGSLGEVGLDEAKLHDKWRLRYSVKEGKPALVYPQTFMPLATYDFDFEAVKWRANAY